MHRIYGIVRMLASKVTGMEKQIADGASADPQTGPAREYQTASAILEEYGFERGEMRGRAAKVSNRLLRFSMTHGHPLRLTVETKRRLFHVDAVQAWLREGGVVLLADMLLAARSSRGQGTLKLVGSA